MKKDSLKQFKLPFIRRVITLDSCESCGHNAAYTVHKHICGTLVKCTKCGYFQILKGKF